MAFAFEKLLVYQKSLDLADQICVLTENFPRGYGFLSDQMNRASLSIAANIAEGNGSFTKPDRRNFFGIARGSVQFLSQLPRLWQQGEARPTHGEAPAKARDFRTREDPFEGVWSQLRPRLFFKHFGQFFRCTIRLIIRQAKSANFSARSQKT